MEEDRLLSICIPTYNRAKCLDRLLQNLYEEVKGIESEVEICISDNDSDDNTAEVVEKWQKKMLIRYNKNDENVGYDKNVVNLVLMARGKFIWYMGDDDLLVSGTVKRFVKDLKGAGGKIAVIYINALIKGRKIKNFSFTDFRIFKNSEAPGFHAGFIGSICVNRDLASKIKIGDVLRGFAPTYFFIECLKSGEGLGVEPEAGIKIVADGELGHKINYTKKAYLSLLSFRYVLEVKRYYPWFRDNFKFEEIHPYIGYFKWIFSLAAIAVEKPDTENAYNVAYRMFLKITESDKNYLVKSFLLISERIRKTHLADSLLVGTHEILRKTIYAPLDNAQPTIRQKDELNLAISECERFL